MKIKPFLSHKRENARIVARLKNGLKMYGAGGWKDTDDLRLGASTEREIRRAILEETGGFLWWGTEKALGSEVINNLEIPTALERAETEPGYPLVPVFVDVSPSAASKELACRIDEESARRFMDRNGIPRKPKERLDDLWVRAARRYVRDAVASLPAGSWTVTFRALSEPSGEHDLTFDWRSIIDPRARLLQEGSLPVLLDALANAREAFQARECSPELSLDSDLPLPLAFLVGHEWRATTRLRLRIRQRAGASFSWIEHDGPLGQIPEPLSRRLEGDGPVVLAVSCGDDSLETAAMAYASRPAHKPWVLSASW